MEEWVWWDCSTVLQSAVNTTTNQGQELWCGELSGRRKYNTRKTQIQEWLKQETIMIKVVTTGASRPAVIIILRVNIFIQISRRNPWLRSTFRGSWALSSKRWNQIFYPARDETGSFCCREVDEMDSLRLGTEVGEVCQFLTQTDSMAKSARGHWG